MKNTPLLLDKPPAVCYHNKRAPSAGTAPAQRRRRKEGRIRKFAMETIRNRTFDEERALYGARGLTVDDCRFDGPADGESAFKEGAPRMTSFSPAS